MGLKEVKDDILKDAEKTAEEIVQEARDEREQIISDAETEAEKIREKAEKELEKEKESLEKRKISNARMNARREKLEKKQEYIDRAYEEFRDRLDDLTDEQKESFVESCLEEVNFDVGAVKASDGFADAVSGHEVEEIDEPGVVVVSENGERRQDFTLDKIVQNYRSKNRQDVANVLFGGGG